ncbi:PIN domain-like protein, partial [Mycena polygramma]
AMESRSIVELATVEGFLRNESTRTFRLGMDISIILESCSAALRTSGVPFQGQQIPALKIFFYQLCQLSKAPVILIFVFDGPHKPSVKRGKRVVHRPTALVEHIKRLIKAFGYYFYEAPAEAEAELAKLNALGYIDGIITEDSDAFVFGAQCVIRTTGPTVNHPCQIYTTESIEHTVGLSADGLLLFALLCGGDYNRGVMGCGPVLAHGLAACGFGARLVQLLTSLHGVDLRRALNSWRDDLRLELKTNSAGLLPHRYPRLASAFPNSFPNIANARQYLQPLTTWSPEYTGPHPNTDWFPREPHVRAITRFCMDKFHWNSTRVLKSFRNNLWSGVTQRMLSSVSFAIFVDKKYSKPVFCFRAIWYTTYSPRPFLPRAPALS